MYEFQEFENGAALADALTVKVAGALAHTIRLHGKAALLMRAEPVVLRALAGIGKHDLRVFVCREQSRKERGFRRLCVLF